VKEGEIVHMQVTSESKENVKVINHKMVKSSEDIEWECKNCGHCNKWNVDECEKCKESR